MPRLLAASAIDNAASCKTMTAQPRVTQELPSLPTVLEVYQRRGRLQVTIAKNEEAIAGLEKILALARAAGDRRLEGEALADLAFAYVDTLSILGVIAYNLGNLLR